HCLGETLEQSKMQLQALFEAMPVGLLVAEAPSGRLVAGNRTLEKMFGGQWPRSQSIADYASWECFHPDGGRVQPDEYPLARALRGEDHPTLEAQARQNDDTRHWICITATSVRDQAGRITWALATIQSIDCTKQVEIQLESQSIALIDQVANRAMKLQESHRNPLAAETRRESAEGQVRQLQKMDVVGQLTGGVAHDFNNMLSVIISGLSLAQRRLARGDSNITRFIDAAMDGAVRAGTLTKRLLAFSRQQPLSPVPLDPIRIVQGMSDLLHRTLGEAIELEMVLSGGVWRIHADASQLENAILNLVVNARDAMPDGGKLTIKTSNAHLDDAYSLANAEATSGQYVLIAVTNTGAGIPREIMDRVFEPFYRTKEVGKGTGLGLSQVYGFIKQSTGHVKIYSEPGYGTTLKVYLPRFYGQQDGLRAAPVPTQAAEGLGSVGEIILVVEDEERVREVAVAALRELSYTVVHADSGLSALRQLDAHPNVTLLFTDIVISGMNGRKLADEVLKCRPELKTLFTTSYTRDAVVHNGVLDAGVDHLGKPYNVDQVAAKVREVLDRS
ncbi:MAG: ATP-binding protein, partial [Janthinobacterium lividum]